MSNGKMGSSIVVGLSNDQELSKEPAAESNGDISSSDAIYKVPVTHKKPKGFSKKLSNAGSWLHDYTTAVKHGRVKPYSRIERKTRAATRNKPWGPHGGQLVELAQLSFDPGNCAAIFAVLERRFEYPPHKWRNVYKALSVLEFLVQRGSDDAVNRAKSDYMRATLERLEGFSYVTPDSRDVGSNVGHRARAIRMLLNDMNQLKAVRENGKIQSLRMAGLNQAAIITADVDRGGSEGGSDSGDNTDENEDHVIEKGAEQMNTNAGETKGVSAEANARHMEALKKLLARKENAKCADCALPGSGSRPTWASVSLGVFICFRCAGIHRGLGVHISQVRSCSLDTWLFNQVEFMASCGGNTHANAYWENGLERKPELETLGDLDNFIKEKYVAKKYLNTEMIWPPQNCITDKEVLAILTEAMDEETRLSRQKIEQSVINESDNVAVDDVREPDLINLMDDIEELETSNDQRDSNQIVNNTYDTVGNQQHTDYAEQLHDIFSSQEQKESSSPVHMKAPTDFESWDMQNLIAEEPQTVPEDNCKDIHEQERTLDKEGKKYKPFWAPNSNVGSQTANPGQNLITQGPEVEFDNAFDFVPAQFTTHSTVESEAELAETLASIGLGSSARAPESSKSKSKEKLNGAILKKSNDILKPHEKKAQDLLLFGLSNFDAASSIASVSAESKNTNIRLDPMKKV
eukprot:jgi/Picsp_1/6185/NSC_03539-R1_arf-gap domain 5